MQVGPQAAEQAIAVGLGEVAVARADTPVVLVAHGLGSCVAICLFDPLHKVAGLAHVVLPGQDPHDRPNAKFAGSALPVLVKAMTAAGSRGDPRQYQARLVGGAHVLAIGGTGALPRIGDKNVEAVNLVLSQAGVPVLGHDVGGGKGRTVWFDPREGGRIRVRTIGGVEQHI
jgi:chemotaxis protein CheD